MKTSNTFFSPSIFRTILRTAKDIRQVKAGIQDKGIYCILLSLDYQEGAE